MTKYGNGGPNGARVYWPIGLAELSPAERAEALARGWWDVKDETTGETLRVYRNGRTEAVTT